MERIRFFIYTFLQWLRRSQPFRPEDIPRRLDAQTLERITQEARWLQGQGVDIRSVSIGEIPIPKPVNPEEFERLVPGAPVQYND